MTHPPNTTWEQLLAFQRQFDAIAALRLLDWKASDLERVAENLVTRAGGLDPLDDWLELVRNCTSEQWFKLRGDALIAIDLRFAAEMLFRFYEDLVAEDAAEPLPEIPRRANHPLKRRLKRSPGELDKTLMEFGLSPHPSVALVLEGPTELLLIPRVMDLLGIPHEKSFIEIINMEGVERELDTFAAHFAAPALGELHGDMARLERPPTTFLVAVDPEGGLRTQEGRDEKRRSWIRHVTEALKRNHSRIPLREDIESLIPPVETWDGLGQCFEFAHFTPREIAAALISLGGGRGQVPSLDELERILISVQAKQRERGASIKAAWNGWEWEPRKTQLAEQLWPILRGNVERARAEGALDSVPAARVVIKALDIAARTHRNLVSIRLEPAPHVDLESEM